MNCNDNSKNIATLSCYRVLVYTNSLSSQNKRMSQVFLTPDYRVIYINTNSTMLISTTK